MFLPAFPFLFEPIGCWASTVARLQEARRHSQGLAELRDQILPFSSRLLLVRHADYPGMLSLGAGR